MSLVPGISRQKQAALSRMQQRFIEEYVAGNGNATAAARKAGYKNGKAVGQQAFENLKKPEIASRIAHELARIGAEITPGRVQRRLHEISHAAQEAGQFGPSVRAEELLGKSIGMWVDQSLQLSGVLKDEHVQALIEIARRRQQEPVELHDDSPHNQSPHERDDG